MEIQPNKYKINYYLSNLWMKKYLNPIYLSSSSSIYLKKNKNLNNSNDMNNLQNKYTCLSKLFDYENKYDKFFELLKKNLNLIKKIGYQKIHNNYFDIECINFKYEGDEKTNINVMIDLISNEDIKMIYKYLYSSIEMKKIIIKKYSKSQIIIKNKLEISTTEPENFRYFTNHHNFIKIIDRLWCIKLLSYFDKYPVDKQIFKSYLIDCEFSQIINLATSNTQTNENKVILDISRAFDSIDWDMMNRLVLSNLSKKIDKNIAKKIIDEYIILLTNRNIYYGDVQINVSSGIPLGLPSSNIMFHFMMEEIISRWCNNNKNYIDYFILNIYVDDIYFEFDESISIIEINYLITNFMNYLRNYGLVINRNKIKFSPNIYTGKLGNVLKETDLYLGVPFTRNIKLYGQIILNQFNNRYCSKLTWKNIHNYINTNLKCSNSLSSFFIFKLKPIIGQRINKNILLKFIEINYFDT